MIRSTRPSVHHVTAWLFLGFVGCSTKTNTTVEKQTDKPVVYTVNYPLTYFARRVGGDHVDVVFPIPPEVDPAYWKPDRNAISGFQSADLILRNGADYAKWIQHATLASSRMVITTRELTDRYIEIPEAITHSHGPGGDHAHASVAMETWLDPQLAIAQAKVIQQEFTKLNPELAAEFQANFEPLQSDLETFDSELTSVVASLPGKWVASHPVYDYLARRYDLQLKSLHWEPDEFPTNQQWQEFEAMIEDHPASRMLWEDVPLIETSRRLAELNVRVVVFRPLGNQPSAGDYLSVMRDNLQNVKASVRE